LDSEASGVGSDLTFKMYIKVAKFTSVKVQAGIGQNMSTNI
jgi:hypothetical protein